MIEDIRKSKGDRFEIDTIRNLIKLGISSRYKTLIHKNKDGSNVRKTNSISQNLFALVDELIRIPFDLTYNDAVLEAICRGIDAEDK